MVIPLEYAYGSDFHDGTALVGRGAPQERKFGIIDTAGREVVPCLYDDALPFSDGRALVMQGRDAERKYGYVDRCGQTRSP